VAYLLKVRIVEPKKESLLGNDCVTRNNGVTVGCGFLCGPYKQWRHATMEKLLEAVFSVRSVQELYNEDQLPRPSVVT
jgi:hypothetical protein